jgi:hypothetical protein
MSEVKFNVTHVMGEQGIEIRALVTEWTSGRTVHRIALNCEGYAQRIKYILDLDTAEAIANDILKAVASTKAAQ